MECDIEFSTIATTVGGKQFNVTLDTIATYLQYRRPAASTITYPRVDDSEIGEEIVAAEVCVDGEPSSSMGDLKPECRTMNKIFHYDLYPHGSEKVLGEIELELLYVFMRREEVMDYADWIFDQLTDFQINPKHGINLPFPAMITQLCIHAGLKTPPRLDSDTPGVINASSENKSKSNVVAAAAPSSSTPKKKPSTLKRLLQTILCRTAEIQEDQRRADHKANFIFEQVVGQSGVRYEPPPELAIDRPIGEHWSSVYSEGELDDDEIHEVERQFNE